MEHEFDKIARKMRETGWEPADIPGGIRDTQGKYVKFNRGKKSRHPSEWFVSEYFHLPERGGIPAGRYFRFSYGSESTGERYSHTVATVSGVDYSLDVRKNHEKHEKAFDEKLREIENETRTAAEKTRFVFEKCSSRDVAGHPYLIRKQIVEAVPVLDLRVNNNGGLLVPVRSIVDDRWMGMQFIWPDGSKFFARGVTVHGEGCFFVGSPKDAPVILLAEGMATGASLYLATGIPTIVGFNAGNLEPVADLARKRFGEAYFVVAGDDDWKNQINVGREKATRVAEAIGGSCVFPKFPSRSNELACTDFNDLHQVSGLDAVREQIKLALESRFSVDKKIILKRG